MRLTFLERFRITPFWAMSRRGSFALVGLATLLAVTQVTLAGLPEGWTSYTGNYFKIGVPPGFQVQPQGKPGAIGKYDELCLWNKKLRVQFSVFSPQWNGQALFAKVADRSEVLQSREEKTVDGVKEVQLEIFAKDNSYIRFVVSQTKLNENTNTTFGIRVPDMGVYGKVKAAYVKWKASLEQYAD